MSFALRLRELSRWFPRRLVLTLLVPLQVLLLRCSLQGRINQKSQITEVLGGEELWGGRGRSVEEAAGGACCGCTGETGALFLGLPQETLRVQLQQRLNGTLFAGVARAGQDGSGGAPEKTEVQRGGRTDDGRPLLGHIAFWRAGSRTGR